MSVTNRKTFVGRPGPSDMFLLHPGHSYKVSTVGALGGSSDVHVYESSAPEASASSTPLTSDWSLLRDTGASGEAVDLQVSAGMTKLVVDVVDKVEGVVVTVEAEGELSEDAGMGQLNNQRQKDSSGRRNVNSPFE